MRLYFTAKNAFGGRVGALAVGAVRNDGRRAALARLAG